MLLRDTHERFGVMSHLLHWSMAALMLFLTALGWYMVDLDYYTSPYYDLSYRLHESLGLLVFGIGIAGLVWRYTQRRRPQHFQLRPWERWASGIVHVLLGFMVLSLPISGYLYAGGDSPGAGFFGLFHLPLLTSISAQWKDFSIAFHYYIAYGGCAFIALHIAAAMKHWLLDKPINRRKSS